MNCYGAKLPKVDLDMPAGDKIGVAAVPLGSGAAMTFLYAKGGKMPDFNANSLVVRLDLGTRHILLMGDAEAGERLEPGEPEPPPTLASIEGHLLDCCAAALKADVLVVGHHGSNTSSRTPFLDAVQASTFIVSTGPTKYQSVVFPDREVMEALKPRGKVLETDTGDAARRTSPAKIGPDADGEPGGCDNILVRIDAAGIVSADYEGISD
jgi:competence protein ComEC